VSTQEEWETAINRGLAKRLKDLEKERERRERASTAADEEFSTEFLGLARKAFQMIDKDDSGTLEKEEILRAVRADQVPHAASYDLQSVICGGTAVFVCLVCGGAESDDSSNYEHTHTQRNNRTTASRFAPFAGRDQLPHKLWQQESPVPVGAVAARSRIGGARHRQGRND
jgi:hypothetical protein